MQVRGKGNCEKATVGSRGDRRQQEGTRYGCDIWSGGPIILPWTVRGDHFRGGTVHGVTARLLKLPPNNQPSELQNSHKRFTHRYFGELMIFTGDSKLSVSLSLDDTTMGGDYVILMANPAKLATQPPRCKW